jgi:hypothetical protein
VRRQHGADERLQFVERLRAKAAPHLHDLTIVANTGYTDVATVQNAGQLRISGQLVKSVSSR